MYRRSMMMPVVVRACRFIVKVTKWGWEGSMDHCASCLIKSGEESSFGV